MRVYLSLIAAAVLAAPAVNAASLYTDQSAFDAALGGVSTVSGGFTGGDNIDGDDNIGSPTTFDNGITITLDQPSTDNEVFGAGFLRLSVDNTGNPDNAADPMTKEIELFFPRAVTAFALEFGEPNAFEDGGTGRGPGNDSGTTLTAGSFTYNFTDEGFGDAPGFTGFFGVIGHGGETFDSVLFTSNGRGIKTDDDFTVTNIQYAPVPLPAGLPLLAAGLGVFGLIKRRKG